MIGTPTGRVTAAPATSLAGADGVPWLAMVALCCVQSVSLLDATVVNVAFGPIMHGLDANFSDMLWVVNLYMLTYAVLLVPAGRLGDWFGGRRILLIGAAAFTTASLLCGLARDPAQAIVFRGVQGVGAAFITAQTMALITRLVPVAERGRAMGFWGAFSGLAACAGPTVGGLLASHAGWRWVFLINVPIGVVSILFTLRWVPQVPGTRTGGRLDLLGAGTLAVSMLLLVYPLIQASHDRSGQPGVTSPAVLLPAGVLVLAMFFLIERGRQGREPLLPFALLRNHDFALMTSLVGVIPGTLGAMLFLTPYYLQQGRGISTQDAGLLAAVAPLVTVGVARYGGSLTDRIGGKYVLVLGLLLFAAGIGGQAYVMAERFGAAAVIPGLAVAGVGMGLAFAPVAALAMADVEPATSGAASGVFNTARMCGSLLTSAVVGAMFQLRAAADDVVGAAHTTMLVPVAILLAGATAALFARQHRRSPPPPAAPRSDEEA